MSSLAIEVKDLVRNFSGFEAVKGISFEVEAGSVVGFIGANGAGKTTTMRILTTLDQQTSGSVKICGIDVLEFPAEVRRKVGWMPDSYGRYSAMTVVEYLDFFARAYGFKGQDRINRIDEVMEFTELTPLAHKPITTLSKGMAQRLCFGRTLIHDPEVFILDEPAAGLDPKARVEFKNLIKILSSKKKTIFISSHILSELGEMCDSLLFIDQGQVVHHGSAESLKTVNRVSHVYRIETNSDILKLSDWLELQSGIKVSEVFKNGLKVTIEEGGSPSELLKKIVENNFEILDYHKEDRLLEDIFIEMLKKVNTNEESEK